MANVEKSGPKAMSEPKSVLLSKYANNPAQFDTTFKDLKALKMKEAPKADVFDKLVTKDKLVLDIPKKFAKEPPKADLFNKLAIKDKLVLDIPKIFAKEAPLGKKIIGKILR